jgi:hypothetical protein
LHSSLVSFEQALTHDLVCDFELLDESVDKFCGVDVELLIVQRDSTDQRVEWISRIT